MKRCAACRRIYDHAAEVCQVDGRVLDDLNPNPLIEQTIAQRYRVIRKLGGGGLGAVYLAEELATGSKVAVKILAKEVRCGREFLKQCWWDARFAAASQPSNIVRVFEVDRTDEGRVFIVMEYLAGESVAEVIQREGALEVGRALRVASQIAQALAAASRARVTHRDIKPQNVIGVGRDEQVKLTDFGVARFRETAPGGSLTGLGAIAPEYTAPEQLRGGDAADRSDIYALGAVLYAMLTGSGPATARRGAADATDLGDAPPPVRRLRPEIPAALEHFVMRAMARQPERRQSSMEELVEGLRDLTASVTAGTATGSTPFVPPERVLERSAPPPDTPTLVPTGPVRWRRHVALWQSSLSSGTRVLTALVNRWRSEGLRWARADGGKLVLAGAAALVMVVAMARAGLDWQPGGRARAPLPVTSLVERRAEGDAELLEAGRHRPAEVQAVRPPAEAEATRALPEASPQRPIARPAEPAPAAHQPAALARDEGHPAQVRAARPEAEPMRPRPAASGQLPIDRPAESTPAASPPAAPTTDERGQPAQVQAARPEAEPMRARPEASPPLVIARPAELAPVAPQIPLLTAQQVSRIQTQAEQKLLTRGLLRVSSADRWGVTLQMASSGEATLSGVLRDMALYAEAIRLVREVPGVQDVRGNVEVSEVGAASTGQLDSAGIQAEIQQRLRRRGLLRESSADRWGVTVEVSAEGDVTLVGAVRDREMQREAVRRAREVAKVRQVKTDIRVQGDEP